MIVFADELSSTLIIAVYKKVMHFFPGVVNLLMTTNTSQCWSEWNFRSICDQSRSQSSSKTC